MKKRIFALILLFTLVFTCAACGDSNATSENGIGTSVQKPTQEPTSTPVDPSTNDDPNNGSDNSGSGLSDQESQQLSLDGYYMNYLSAGLAEVEGCFLAWEEGVTVYAPYLAYTDVNGDGYFDIIVTGDLGVRDKKVTLVYYFNSNEGTFHEVYFYGRPVGISDGAILVIDEDNDGPSVYYTYKYVYALDGENVNEIVSYALVEEFTEGEDEPLVSESFKIGGEPASDADWGETYNPYTDNMTTVEFTALDAELTIEMFASKG